MVGDKPDTKWYDDNVATSDHFNTDAWYQNVHEGYDKLLPPNSPSREAWDQWYQSAIRYLHSQNVLNTRYGYVQNIRKDTIRILLLAIFRAEHDWVKLSDEEEKHKQERYQWFYAKCMEAHEQYPDIITYFLQNLKYYDDDDALKELVSQDLHRLLAAPPPFVSIDLIRAMTIYHEPVKDVATPAQVQRWLRLLDDSSLLVACAAADSLAQRSDILDGDQTDIIALITQKELHRPGIAGAFCMGIHLEGILFPGKESERKTAEWMMDMMERRQGRPEWGPDNDATLSNDISFYLHELCEFDPNMVERMMQDGFFELALLTATEQRGYVKGMEIPLQKLAHHQDDEIKNRARAHLDTYYKKS